MNFLNTIFYKSLVALYKLNTNKDGRAKSIIIDAIFEALVIGKEGLEDSVLEMALSTATDDWLDFWGNTFGVYRVYDENDDKYRKRIINEIISPKCTIPALKKATARYLSNNYDMDLQEEAINIFEPYTELLKFDERGVLDGDGRMISYDYWNYAVIDISLPDSTLITPALIEYLNRIKAGGVKIFFSIAPSWNIIVDPLFEEKRYRIWQRIYRDTMMIAHEPSDGFKLLLEGDLELIDDTDRGGILDSYGLLEGRQQIYWNGVSFMRSMYVTGAIRNHLGTAVLSLEDFKTISENEELTIEEAIQLEEESFEGTREKEGKLTISQNYIEHITERTSELYYLAYTKNEPLTLSFIDDVEMVKFLGPSCMEKLKIEEPDLTTKEFLEILNNPSHKPLLTDIVRSFLIQKIKENNINESIQGQLIIEKEK